MKTQYGVQMYSLRDITASSMKNALKEVSQMGYKYVEFAGFFNHSAKEIKGWLDEFDLLCCGTHTTLDALSPHTIDQTIACHKEIGCDAIYVPCCDWSTKEKCDEAIFSLNFAAKRLSEHDISLGYHNHSEEFFPTSDGIVFEDEIINKTNCLLQIDTFWLCNAGIEVIKYLEDHKDRIKVIHLKDGIPTGAQNHSYENVNKGYEEFSVGLGSLPINEIRNWCIKNNVGMVVESEGLNPSGVEEVKRCIDYLKTLE